MIASHRTLHIAHYAPHTAPHYTPHITCRAAQTTCHQPRTTHYTRAKRTTHNMPHVHRAIQSPASVEWHATVVVTSGLPKGNSNWGISCPTPLPHTVGQHRRFGGGCPRLASALVVGGNAQCTTCNTQLRAPHAQRLACNRWEGNTGAHTRHMKHTPPNSRKCAVGTPLK